MKPAPEPTLKLSGNSAEITHCNDQLLARIEELTKRIERLEQTGISQTRLGPQTPDYKADEEAVKKVVSALRDSMQKKREAEVPPVDRNARVLASGLHEVEMPDYRDVKENGQQKDYVVLTADERAKGLVRPVRDAYKHLKCGKVTTMNRSIAETYARDPAFYSGTFCTTCQDHFPVGEDGEFVWYENDGTIGPKVGT
jgi:hypothetical protein